MHARHADMHENDGTSANLYPTTDIMLYACVVRVILRTHSIYFSSDLFNHLKYMGNIITINLVLFISEGHKIQILEWVSIPRLLDDLVSEVTTAPDVDSSHIN